MAVTVHNFSNGILNPAVAYFVSCLGGFLGLRCVTRARAYTGLGRAAWLSFAAVSVGATGIWAMHFIAMLGFSMPGQQITYNVPVTIGSMLLAIFVVGIGLFIVGYSSGGPGPLLLGGTILGVGVNAMHYMGMSAMVMPGSVHYNPLLVAASVLIAVVAGTVALWFGTRVKGILATIGAALIMGVAVTGMHYTGMAALSVSPGSMTGMSGSTAFSFMVPAAIALTVVTFAIAMAVSVARTEDEITEDVLLQRRIDEAMAASGYPSDAQRPRGYSQSLRRKTK